MHQIGKCHSIHPLWWKSTVKSTLYHFPKKRLVSDQTIIELCIAVILLVALSSSTCCCVAANEGYSCNIFLQQPSYNDFLWSTMRCSITSKIHCDFQVPSLHIKHFLSFEAAELILILLSPCQQRALQFFETITRHQAKTATIFNCSWIGICNFSTCFCDTKRMKTDFAHTALLIGRYPQARTITVPAFIQFGSPRRWQLLLLMGRCHS
jgi:hypothetical protein